MSASISGHNVPVTTDQARAFNIAAQVLFMVNCTPFQDVYDSTEHSYVPFSWRREASASRLITEAFPTTEHSYFDNDGSAKGADVLSMLAAKHLQKAGLHLEATDDLRAHLSLDSKRGTVRIFHRTSILKETLRMKPHIDQLPDQSGSTNLVIK
jgi:hypothetical protein